MRSVLCSSMENDDQGIEFALDSKGFVRISVWRNVSTENPERVFKAMVPRLEFDILLSPEPTNDRR